MDTRDNHEDPLAILTTTKIAEDLAHVVRGLYADGQTDYSLEPIVLEQADGTPVGRIKDGDAVIFCCRRGEREIQLTEAFTDPNLDQFPREPFAICNSLSSRFIMTNSRTSRWRLPLHGYKRRWLR